MARAYIKTQCICVGNKMALTVSGEVALLFRKQFSGIGYLYLRPLPMVVLIVQL